MSIRNAVLLAVLCLGVCSAGLCEDLRFDSIERGTREFGVGFAYGENHKYPAATKNRYAFDMLAVRYGKFTSPTTEVAAELVVGQRHMSEENAAVSINLDYRRHFMVRGRTALGYDLSFGVTRLGKALTEQSSRFNFTEQVGLVFLRSTGPSSAVALQYNFSHTSNAGIKLPNIGLNASAVTLTFSWYD